MCRESFSSEGAHNRICPKCKPIRAWRNHPRCTTRDRKRCLTASWHPEQRKMNASNQSDCLRSPPGRRTCRTRKTNALPICRSSGRRDVDGSTANLAGASKTEVLNGDILSVSKYKSANLTKKHAKRVVDRLYNKIFNLICLNDLAVFLVYQELKGGNESVPREKTNETVQNLGIAHGKRSTSLGTASLRLLCRHGSQWGRRSQLGRM